MTQPPSPPDLTPLALAVARCDTQGRCVCGETAGHAGWLLCVQRLLREEER